MAARDAEIVKLKKDDDNTTVNTTAQVPALFSTDGVHINTAKAKAEALLGERVPDDASKDVIVAKLDILVAAPWEPGR